MSDGKGLVNIDLSGIGEAASKLIEKVSGGIGGAFAPRQVVRMAKANAEANLIAANSHVEITDLQRRALARLAAEEARKQENIEQITMKAIPLLEDNSNPQNMEDDWVANFFEKSRIVSDEEMQSLWSRLLASEANSPGSVSKRAINILSDLDKSDAQHFSTICNFGWHIGGNLIPLVFYERDAILLTNKINYEVLGHLESLGLLRLAATGEFQLHFEHKPMLPVTYFKRGLILQLTDQPFRVGKILLTPTGRQLSRIAVTAPIDGVFEYVEKKFSERKLLVNDEQLTQMASKLKPRGEGPA